MTSRSRSQAACDSCRLRKTRCARDNEEESCVLCRFHGLKCTFRHNYLRRQRRRHSSEVENTPGQAASAQIQTQEFDRPSAASPPSTHTSPASNDELLVSAPPAAAYPSILNDTLGLDPANHAECIGPSDYRDPILLDLRQPNTTSSSFVRRMDDRTLFVVQSDIATVPDNKRIAVVDSVEAAVHPIGHILVDLYFRFVHPSFPILHKDVFVTKHQASYRHMAPALLAAVYLLSLDWQIHDSRLVSGDSVCQPDISALEQLAETALQDDMRTPKLSTLEAEWEIGLRRRLGWALYMQDRWTAFVHGRPALLHSDDWDLQPCSSSDFPEYTKVEGLSMGVVAAPTGWRVFLRHIELTQILNEITQTYYTTAATRRDGSLDRIGVCAAVDLAQPIIARLSQWKTTLPDDLAFTTPYTRSLCASASLHLAYHVVIIALYRALVRILTPETPPTLHATVRSAAREKLQGAIQLLSSMSPEHTAAFWGSVASYQVAMIGSFAGLLWATAETGEEMAWCATRLDDLKWALRVRGAAATFAKPALHMLEREIGGLSVIEQIE
ncbi:hypothetical protein F4806DRAFT_488983 [Annulohypoxylon nitens]|nr:hypothetical protein F4806DRAFT_488983 [Annulohypoxylon nitens]